MGNLILATPILSDAATITAGTSTAAGPVTNLQKMQPTDLWQSATATAYCEIDLGAVTAFNLVALLATNAVATDTWRIRTADTQGNLTAAPTHDSTATALTGISPDGSAWYWVAAGLSNRWVRIDMATAANPFMAGRLYVANALITTRNYKWGAQDGFDDDSAIDSTDGAAIIPNQGANRAVFDFTMTLEIEAERHAMREVNRLRGASSDVLVIRDPDAATNRGDHIYYGLLQRRRTAVHTAFNHHELAYQLTSLSA